MSSRRAEARSVGSRPAPFIASATETPASSLTVSISSSVSAPTIALLPMNARRKRLCSSPHSATTSIDRFGVPRARRRPAAAASPARMPSVPSR